MIKKSFTNLFKFNTLAQVALLKAIPSFKFGKNWKPQKYTGGGGLTKSRLTRCCFQMTFDPTQFDQYLKDHETVWPEMQKALVRCGWHNYSLFYRPDGFAVGYFETDTSFKKACKRMEKEKINNKWQITMSKYTQANVRPDQAFSELTHYFYLGTDKLNDKKPKNQKNKK